VTSRKRLAVRLQAFAAQRQQGAAHAVASQERNALQVAAIADAYRPAAGQGAGLEFKMRARFRRRLECLQHIIESDHSKAIDAQRLAVIALRRAQRVAEHLQHIAAQEARRRSRRMPPPRSPVAWL